VSTGQGSSLGDLLQSLKHRPAEIARHAPTDQLTGKQCPDKRNRYDDALVDAKLDDTSSIATLVDKCPGGHAASGEYTHVANGTSSPIDVN
jgi:hypothetical protein